MQINQPAPVIVIICICGVALFCMFLYELVSDIKYYRYKKWLDKKTDNKCPVCNKKLRVKNVNNIDYGDINYFIYCDKCKTMYKIKYKEKLNDYESNNKRKIK